MGEFVGKRVVPDHVGLWSQDKVYEPLMIVLNGATGDSYISRRAVPVGIYLSDESYWSLCAHYSAQMRKLEQDVKTDVQQMHSAVDAAQSAMSKEMADTQAAISRELTETHDAIGRGLTETEQRVESSLQETTAQVTQQVSAARSELNTGRQELKDTREVLNSRMDSIVGGATSDTEVLDARVGVDGTVYENLGTHIRSGFAAVYNAPSEQAGREALDEVTEKWEEKYPRAMKRWYDSWDAVSPIFKFSKDVRTVIYTTNAIESLNATYRRLNSQRSVFPSDTALLKALYLATFEATKKWTMPIRNWGRVYGELSIMYDDRLPD